MLDVCLYQSEGGWRLAVPRTAYVIPGRVGLGRTWRRRVRFRFRFRCFRFRVRCFRLGGSRPTLRRPTRDPPGRKRKRTRRRQARPKPTRPGITHAVRATAKRQPPSL